MKSKFIIITITITITFSIFVISGCSDKSSPTNPSSSNPASLSSSKFSDIQKSVFSTSCALSGCHAGSSVQANLNLTEGNAYNNLVNRQSVLNPSFVRVKPGDSQNSFLIKMLRNSGNGSSLMPPTGALNPAIIDSIEAWINNGALNN
jgi:hypothetical protein